MTLDMATRLKEETEAVWVAPSKRARKLARRRVKRTLYRSAWDFEQLLRAVERDRQSGTANLGPATTEYLNALDRLARDLPSGELAS